MIFLEGTAHDFPNHFSIDESGIVAIGGNLSPELLKNAYRKGIFPWYDEKEEPIVWWSPNPRFVLYPNELKISKSTRKILKENRFQITYNQCFVAVMKHCMFAKRKDQEGTWINQEMVESYAKLHQEGFAKSVEVWQNNELVGGLYGIDLGTVFCGESMFSKVSNASKIGFITFIQEKLKDYKLIDCQVHTEYLEGFGAKEINRDLFLKYLT